MRKTLTALTLAAALLAPATLAGCGDLAEAGSTTAGEESTSKSDKKSEKKAKSAGTGDVVRDGKFAFKVTKVTTASKVGDQYLSKKAQGKFVLVHVTVRNRGDEPQSMFGDNQYLFDAKKRKFSADTEAAIYLGDKGAIFDEINPGNSLRGIVVFDVPKTVKPTRLELHDSAFSGGVSVQL